MMTMVTLIKIFGEDVGCSEDFNDAFSYLQKKESETNKTFFIVKEYALDSSVVISPPEVYCVVSRRVLSLLRKMEAMNVEYKVIY